MTKYEPPSENNIRWLYQLLIGMSWNSADTFEKWQSTWNNLKEALGIEEMTDNGHGRIIWGRGLPELWK